MSAIDITQVGEVTETLHGRGRSPTPRPFERAWIAASLPDLRIGRFEAPRVVICGGPRSGKSSLAAHLGERNADRIRHTDHLIGTHRWDEAVAEVADWFNRPAPWIVEGVVSGEALGARLDAERDTKPCDLAIFLHGSRKPLSMGQAKMAAKCLAAWESVREVLRARGVELWDVGDE